MRVGGTFNIGTADMGLRFPGFWGIQTGLYYQSQSNFTAGIHLTPLFGSVVTQSNIFGSIVGSTGSMIDKNGNPAVIRLYMRGVSALGTVGKLIPLSAKTNFSAIEVRVGAGYLNHKIRMQFDAATLPQLEGDYLDGYDRLTNGLLLQQSVYFQYVNLQTLSFFGGIDFNQGLTKSRRAWTYASKSPEDKMRKDIYFGISAGILIPISMRSRSSSSTYYD